MGVLPGAPGGGLYHKPVQAFSVPEGLRAGAPLSTMTFLWPRPQPAGCSLVSSKAWLPVGGPGGGKLWLKCTSGRTVGGGAPPQTPRVPLGLCVHTLLGAVITGLCGRPVPVHCSLCGWGAEPGSGGLMAGRAAEILVG